MLSSSLDTLLKLSKTTSPQKLLAYDCVTLYIKSFKCFKQLSALYLIQMNINIYHNCLTSEKLKYRNKQNF